jgi:hypothetical protein
MGHIALLLVGTLHLYPQGTGAYKPGHERSNVDPDTNYSPGRLTTRFAGPQVLRPRAALHPMM